MQLKKFFSYVITAVMIISSGFVTVSAEAKATPRLSVSEYETKLMTEQKDYTIKLSNARKSKVTWKVKKNKGISSPVLKVVSKSKKRIVVEPLRNGDGTIECRVGKKRIICNYSVYLKQQTEEADKDLSDDELYQKVMNNEIPVIDNRLYYDYQTDSQQRYNDWFYLSGYDYKITGKADLDNDGLNEVMVDTDEDYMYGGIYLDASDGKVFVLGRGDGTSAIISHMTYKGAEWIVYSDTMHTDRNSWDFYRYDGYGDPVDNFLIGWTTPEDSYESHDVYDEDCDFFYNDENITEDEYIDYLKELGLTDYLNDEDL